MKPKQILLGICLVLMLLSNGCASSIDEDLDPFPVSLTDIYFHQQVSPDGDKNLNRMACFGLSHFSGFGTRSKEVSNGIYLLLKSKSCTFEMHVCVVINNNIARRYSHRIDVEVFEKFNSLIDLLRIQSSSNTVSQFFMQGENTGGLYLCVLSNDETLRVLALLRDYLPDEPVVDLLLDRLQNELKKDSQGD